MRLLSLLVALWIGWTSVHQVAAASPTRIKKVLPHYLDLDSRHTTAPSLYERDAYQDYLRKHPEEQSGLRFDVQYQPGEFPILLLRVEMRGNAQGKTTRASIAHPVIRRGRWSQWSAVTIQGEEFAALGKLIAWRASLWDGDRMVTEQRSFLWSD